jgi:ParB family chromosome partitioning protein
MRPIPDSIRRMVLSGTVRGSDPRARLVGRDAYLAAGGRIERELFDDDDSESWADVALARKPRRGEDGRAGQGARCRAGLAWVKPTLDPYASHDLVEGLVRLPAEPAPLTEAELARLDELDASYDEHAAILEDEDSAEEAVAAAEAAIEAIERECQDIRAARRSGARTQGRGGHDPGACRATARRCSSRCSTASAGEPG